MIQEIIKEKTSADHLMYVSLKYTKTCDVILNLIERWKCMIELSFDALIEKSIKEKKLPHLPESPKQKIEFMKKISTKMPATNEVIQLFIFFKRIPGLEKEREGEFRKNVCLRILEPNKTTDINLEKLKEYTELLERFISEVKHNLSK